MFKKISGLGLLAVLGLLALSCSQEPVALSFTRPEKNTTWAFTLIGSSRRQAQKAFDLASAEIDRWQLELEPDNLQGSLAKINEFPGSGPVAMGPIEPALRLGLEASRATQGAFDFTDGRLEQAWSFAVANHRVPTGKETKLALQRTGYAKMVFYDSSASLRLAQPGMRLNLRDLSRGFCLDQAAAVLRAQGFNNFMIQTGGLAYAMGKDAQGKPWQRSLHAFGAGPKEVWGLDLQDACLAFREDPEQGNLKNRRSLPIFDPRDGKAIGGGACLMSAVLIPIHSHFHAAAWGAALSRAAYVKGHKQGLALLESLKVPGRMVFLDPAKKLRVTVATKEQGSGK